MAEHAIEIDWASASVEDADLTVALTDTHSKQWGEAFVGVLERLDTRASGWGTIKLGKRKINVADVEPGAENDLRHLLESVVLQANATISAEPADSADSERSEPDEEMTAAFRAFATR